MCGTKFVENEDSRTSLVVQWMSLPANIGDAGLSLVWEDSMCRGAAKPMHHSYWALALEPVSRSY